MEVEIMLKQPELLAGLEDLLEDEEPTVVKRSIRVFANVYRHAISALASEELTQDTFVAAWPAMKGLAVKLMGMLETAENEGVTIHILRFLEAALVAHLVSDISAYPEVESGGMSVVAKGVECLSKLLSTPYVGGSSFIVAMRAIITVACYKPDLREGVISLIEKQIGSPPPTLFDHNVRSCNKILQRNLFRILRRTTCVSLRHRLVEMMVTVGVPRKMLAQWAPPQEGRKRAAQLPNNDDIISGRNSPPTKKLRNENSSDDEGRLTPTNPREFKAPLDPRLGKEFRDDSSGIPKDPRQSSDREESTDIRVPHSESSQSPQSTPPRQTTMSPPQSPRSSLPNDAQPAGSEKPPSKPSSPCTSGRSTPEGNVKAVSSNFEFLKNLITSTKETTAAKPFLQKCTHKERTLYERLDHPRVVEVVLYCLECVPDSPPDDLLSQLGFSGGDVNGIREHLTRTLAPHITEDFINTLTPPHEPSSGPVINPANLSRPSSTSSTAFSFRSSPPPSTHRVSSPPSPPSSSRSTPIDPHQVCASDVDLRKYLDRGFKSSGDIDMRTSDPRKGFRDPRMTKADTGNSRAESIKRPSRNSPVDPRLSSTETSAITSADPRVSKSYTSTSDIEQRTAVAQSTAMDPRITMNNNQRVPGLMDPCLPPPFSDGRDPRTGGPPNAMMNDSNFHTNRNFPLVGPFPRMAMQNGGFDPNFGPKFGMHCGGNYPNPRMNNNMMNFGKNPLENMPLNINNRVSAMNGNEPRFVGRPGLFGPGPPMNGGPWQNMPMRGNGQGLYPQAPPMHL